MTSRSLPKALSAQTALNAVVQVVVQFSLRSLQPSLAACRELAEHDAPLDVAVLGQFKSGKTSLLNALVGHELLPVGVLPVTAVVTRLSAGEKCAARVTFLNGRVEPIAMNTVADFVAEASNPGNRRQIACVDVDTPALAELRGLRLVDTPGLGSILAHNTQSTQQWLPHMAVALVVISADRPLADEDRRLLAEVRRHAPRVAVILSKVDLLSESQRAEVEAFVREGLRRVHVGDSAPILPFSTRTQTDHWKTRLSSELLLPLARQIDVEREKVLHHKLAGLMQACREYLTVALRAAERTQEQREALKAAVLNESVREAVVRDELSLTAQRMIGATRAAFEAKLKPRRAELAESLVGRAKEELPGWRGNLAVQRQRFEDWLHGELMRELYDVSLSIAPLARQLVEEAQQRFARLVEAFRDRLSRNMDAALGITLSPLRWVTRPIAVPAPPIAVGKVFDIQIDLLWFLVPMPLLGGLFHGHFRRRIPWEVEKNLSRLAADWSDVLGAAIADLHKQAWEAIGNEIASLTEMLGVQPTDAEALREHLTRLENARLGERATETESNARGIT